MSMRSGSRLLGLAGLALLIGGLSFPALAQETSPAPLDDAQWEQALLEGEVIEIKDIGTGVTKPKKVTLRWGERTVRAAFKYVDRHETGRRRFESGPEKVTLSFTDSYRYERAAYLLDRRLGLGMVPVAVFREVDGTPGVLIAWIEDALTEGERLAAGIKGQESLVIVRQKALMRAFDALIFNVDRNQGNRLYTNPGWRLHLIDHSRAFRVRRHLPEDFTKAPLTITRELAEAMRSLERDELRTLLEGSLSRAQIKQLLARRDRLIAKLDRDVAAYGEKLVFVSPPPNSR